MHSAASPSGIPAVGDVTWGAHFCQFYQTRHDLVDSLVPYFRAGLEHNEQCIWVTSEPLRAHEAFALLKQAVPDLADRVARGQIEIVDHDEWYQRNGTMTAEQALQGWLDREQQALSRGRRGLRLTGNTAWLEHANWADFADYEARVNEAFRGRKIIGLCSYHLHQCDACGVLDVVENHQFALARRRGDWELLESASMKLAKGELRKLNEELEQRVAERTAQLEAALRVRDEFLSVASHELKTPLASLQLYVDGLLRAHRKGGLSDEEAARRLVRAQEQCGRLETLIDHLLDVSRAGSRGPALSLSRVDLAAVAGRAVRQFTEQCERAGSRIELRAPRPVEGRCDAVRLDQVLTNLVANALKHAPGADVDVEVDLDAAGDRALLRVRDHGPGIPPGDQERVFERFVQLAPDRHPGGFGLGLWIVRQIVTAMGGTIELRNAPGAGAEFTVALPREPGSN